MRKMLGISMLLTMILLVACQSNQVTNDNEIKMLEVDFPLAKTATVDKKITLKAVVTYGENPEPDADKVQFEYWKKGDKDNSTMIDATNHHDGTYTATVHFSEAATYEVYAHVTADELHTMPLKSITIQK